MRKVNRSNLEAQQDAAARMWARIAPPPQPGDVHDERQGYIPWTGRDYKRTLIAVACLLAGVGFFLVLLAPFFY